MQDGEAEALDGSSADLAVGEVHEVGDEARLRFEHRDAEDHGERPSGKSGPDARELGLAAVVLGPRPRERPREEEARGGDEPDGRPQPSSRPLDRDRPEEEVCLVQCRAFVVGRDRHGGQQEHRRHDERRRGDEAAQHDGDGVEEVEDPPRHEVAGVVADMLDRRGVPQVGLGRLLEGERPSDPLPSEHRRGGVTPAGHRGQVVELTHRTADVERLHRAHAERR